MKLKKILSLAICLIGTGVFTSCDDFLTIYPKDQIDSSYLLEYG